MQSMQTAHPWLLPRLAPSEPTATPVDAPQQSVVEAPAREHDGRLEIARLRDEIEALVQGEHSTARETVDSALESVTQLQIVTANLDACGPPPASHAGAVLVAFADAHLRGHSDAIERGMTYTADNQLRLLLAREK